MSKPLTPLFDRFLRMVSLAESGCWIWQGALHDTGYGMIGLGRRGEGVDRAHRVSWRMAFGDIPPGMYVLHACDVRACVNPGHLFLGTQTDNMRDMSSKGRHSAPAAKLLPADVVKLRLLRSHGRSVAELSAMFGIQPRQVRRILRGERWRHVA